MNNITISASEDLGGGMTASGAYTMRTNLATGENASGQSTAVVAAGNAQWRNTYASIAGGFGSVKAGRWGLAGLYSFDPFGATGTIATYAGSGTAGSRYNSMAQYTTPTVSGVSAALGMTAQGVSGTQEAAWAYVNYGAGPVAASVLYEKNQAVTASQFETMGAGVSYDLGTVKLMGGYTSTTYVVGGAAVSETYNLGLTAPVGAATGKFAYVKDNTSGVNTIAVGVDYAMSKTALLFADIGKTSNLSNPTFQVGFQKGF